MTLKRIVIIGGVLAAVVTIGTLAWVERARLRRLMPEHASSAAELQPSAPSPAPAASTPRGDVTIDARRQQLMGIRTVKVTRANLAAEPLRAVGTVRYDEARLSDVNSKTEGWIRELFVDYTGERIREGEPLFTLYSPDLLTTEREFVLALTTRDQLQASTLPDARTLADALVSAARQRLTLWDLPAAELRDLEATRRPADTVVYRAPVGGFVIEKQAVKGAHIMPGQSLYKIADLSVVWVEADVYEQEIGLIHVGQSATVTLDAYPAERFTGRVAYIYPYVDDKTRTNRVRYAFDNADGRLKPGMFANVALQLAAGMGLALPVDAVLDSGTEQVVFVAQGEGHYEPRHVTVGRHFGDQVEILEGLKVGEDVATGAAFFLDSESQLRGLVSSSDTAPVAAMAAPAAQLAITLTTDPASPKLGENAFLVFVADRNGQPIADADVTVKLFMPAMPTMNMPAMRNEVTLSRIGNGQYRGTGQLPMGGRWDATVVVVRGGQRLGSLQAALVAR